MAGTKNLCAQIPIPLHERVSEERERLGQTTSEYITQLIQEYYNKMENQKGCSDMTEKSRTMVFQIPEELFQRIKRHLERETLCTGRKLTQREFVLNLITKALDEAEGEDGSAKGSPHSPLSHPVWAKQTLRTRTPPAKKAPCKPAKAKVKDNRITYGERRPGRPTQFGCPGRLFAFHQRD